MSTINDAIARLGVLATSCTDVVINYASTSTKVDGAPFPFTVPHILEGEATQTSEDTLQFQPTIAIDVHFSAVNTKHAYDQANRFIVEYCRRIGGDPTLDGSIDTVVFPLVYDVGPDTWNSIDTLRVRFTLPMKDRLTPLT